MTKFKEKNAAIYTRWTGNDYENQVKELMYVSHICQMILALKLSHYAVDTFCKSLETKCKKLNFLNILKSYILW